MRGGDRARGGPAQNAERVSAAARAGGFAGDHDAEPAVAAGASGVCAGGAAGVQELHRRVHLGLGSVGGPGADLPRARVPDQLLPVALQPAPLRLPDREADGLELEHDERGDAAAGSAGVAGDSGLAEAGAEEVREIEERRLGGTGCGVALRRDDASPDVAGTAAERDDDRAGAGGVTGPGARGFCLCHGCFPCLGVYFRHGGRWLGASRHAERAEAR